MNIIGKYIHGSEDSHDVDVHYIVDELPSLAECKRFCSADPSENRNLIVIDDGIVVDCYKGAPDEVNNGIYATYYLHVQTTEPLVTRCVERNIPIKIIRSVRGILSHLSRSQYRSIIKPALKGSWDERLNCLSQIDLTEIDFDSLLHNMSGDDIKKFIAFQVGQCMCLMKGIECYTKRSISKECPMLSSYINRESTEVLSLNLMLYHFVDMCKVMRVSCEGNVVIFENYDEPIKINLISEMICD